MKKILMLCMVSMLIGGLAFSQAQDPEFSNTVYTDFGNADYFGHNGGRSYGFELDRNDTDVRFHGFTNYFTAHIDLGKLIIAGDIIWNIGFDDGFATAIYEPNFNVVMQPFTGLDIGVGTNLEWEVGPAPSDGPIYSAYDVPYYAGLAWVDGNASERRVQNYFADTSLAVRYAFEDLIQVGFALHGGATSKNFDAGLGIKATIRDLFTLGFAYNGPFKTATTNSIYVGSTISAIDNLLLDVWWNLVPNGTGDDTSGNGTVGARFGFHKDAFYLAPEFSMTLWNEKNKSLSMYIALDTHMSITTTMLAGLKASWGLGSDPDTNDDTNSAGARLNINPYFIWNLSETNKLSVGVNFMPVWWQTKDAAGDKLDFFWSIPIAWKVNF